MLESFYQREQLLLEVGTSFSKVLEERQHKSLLQRLEETLSKLTGNRFYLVILGQFKRGKTTLINAFLGQDLLPTAVVPLTSIATLVEYGDLPGARVVYRNGSTQDIPLEALSAYVTERGNPRNTKGVQQVEVFAPAELLREGVQLVDTPGVGSVYTHNTDVAYEFLPRADAGIFLVTADPPISEQELSFLRDVQGFVPRIFFVQNKIDHLSPEEREESLRFTCQVLEQEAGFQSLMVYPVSAKMALDAAIAGDTELMQQSGLPALREELERFLMEEKGEVVLTSVTGSLTRMIQEELSAIALERRAIETPLEELEAKIAAFNEHLMHILKERDDDLYLLRRRIDQLVGDWLDKDIERLKEEHKPRLLDGLDACLEGESSAREILERVNHYLKESIERLLQTWKVKEEKRLALALPEALAPFTEKTNRTIAQVGKLSENLFDIPWQPFVPEETLSPRSRFYFKPWEMKVGIEGLSSSILTLLPRGWVQGILRKEARLKLLEQLEMTTGRMREDFARRIQKSILDYSKSLNERVEATIEGIRQAIERAADRQHQGQEATQQALCTLQQYDDVLQESMTYLKRLSRIGAPNGMAPSGMLATANREGGERLEPK